MNREKKASENRNRGFTLDENEIKKAKYKSHKPGAKSLVLSTSMPAFREAKTSMREN